MRRAIAEDLSTLGGGVFGTEDIFITNGATSAIYASLVAGKMPGFPRKRD